MRITQNVSRYDLPVIERERVRQTRATDHTQAPPGTAEYRAPSGAPPPWWLFSIEPEIVYAFGTDETGGATRYEMQPDDE